MSSPPLQIDPRAGRESPPFNYYGGKWRAALRYPRPLHSKIIEPFAGGAGYSLRYWWLDVTLLDVDSTLIHAWQWLQQASARDVMLLGNVTPGARVCDLSSCSGVQAFARHNANPASTGGRPNFTARGANRWNRQRQAWSRWPDRVRHWEIFAGDYRLACDSIATWFIDPPYSTSAGQYYKSDSLNYTKLSNWCETRSGQRIVCEQFGADWLPFQILGHVKGQAKRNNRDRKNIELIWHTEGAKQ